MNAYDKECDRLSRIIIDTALTHKAHLVLLRRAEGLQGITEQQRREVTEIRTRVDRRAFLTICNIDLLCALCALYKK